MFILGWMQSRARIKPFIGPNSVWGIWCDSKAWAWKCWKMWHHRSEDATLVIQGLEAILFTPVLHQRKWFRFRDNDDNIIYVISVVLGCMERTRFGDGFDPVARKEFILSSASLLHQQKKRQWPAPSRQETQSILFFQHMVSVYWDGERRFSWAATWIPESGHKEQKQPLKATREPEFTLFVHLLYALMPL